MSSDEQSNDCNKKILSAALKFVSDGNENLRLKSEKHDLNEPKIPQRVRELEAQWRNEKAEREEKREKAEQKLQEATAALANKELEVKRSLEVFVSQTKRNESQVAELLKDCDRLRSEKLLTVQEKEEIIQSLLRNVQNSHAERREFTSLVSQAMRKAKERDEQVTSMLFSQAQEAQQYRRQTEALTDEMLHQETQSQEQLKQEQSVRTAQVASLKKQQSDCEEAAEEALKENLQLQESLAISNKEKEKIEEQSTELELQASGKNSQLQEELELSKVQVGNLQKRLTAAEHYLHDEKFSTVRTGGALEVTQGAGRPGEQRHLSPGMQISVATLDALQTLVAGLVPQENRRSSVVVVAEYVQSCRDLAEGRATTIPGPVQCPDLSKPCGTADDARYLHPDVVAALCAVFGGAPAVTVEGEEAWYYDGKMALRDVALFDDQGWALEIPGRNGQRLHQCHLPVDQTFYDSLQEYIGYRPSVLKVRNTDEVIEPSITVGDWRSGRDRAVLTVLK